MLPSHASSRRSAGSGRTVAGLLAILALIGGDPWGMVSEMAGAAQPAPRIEGRGAPMGTDVSTVVEGNNRFALDLYGRLRGEQPGNLFFSPSSLSTALAMTYAGARGETEAQMARVLHFN